MDWLSQPIIAIISAIFAAGGAYGATRIELRHLWREIERIAEENKRAHERIDRYLKPITDFRNYRG